MFAIKKIKRQTRRDMLEEQTKNRDIKERFKMYCNFISRISFKFKILDKQLIYNSNIFNLKFSFFQN
jgi:hypothetical protein